MLLMFHARRLPNLVTLDRAGVGHVVLCSSFREKKQRRSVRKDNGALQQPLSRYRLELLVAGSFTCWSSWYFAS